MKKGKIISMPATAESQIRTRARNLPLDKCYVNNDWEETGCAEVIVTRKHVNGNLTFGFYMVDLFLLGIEECYYAFNELPHEVEERFESYEDFEECDYELAHNIIFEGIAFAEECGFKPVKDFIKTAKYILEEDTDDIPRMDIPVGESGIPVVFVTPEKNRQRELAILDKTVGHENYIVAHVDEEGHVIHVDIDDNEEDDSQFSYDIYTETVEELIDKGVENFLEKNTENLSPTKLMAFVDYLYEENFWDKINQDDFDYFQLIIDDDRYDPILQRVPELDKYLPAIQSIVDKTEDDRDVALAEMQALVDKYPDDVHIGIAQIALLIDFEIEDQLEQKVMYWYNREPNHYAIRIFYAEWLALHDRYHEIFELFDNKPGLDAISTENVIFTKDMLCNFCACYVLAWLSKDDISKAESYYRLLLMEEETTTLVNKAFFNMIAKKRKELKDLLSSV